MKQFFIILLITVSVSLLAEDSKQYPELSIDGLFSIIPNPVYHEATQEGKIELIEMLSSKGLNFNTNILKEKEHGKFKWYVTEYITTFMLDNVFSEIRILRVTIYHKYNKYDSIKQIFIKTNYSGNYENFYYAHDTFMRIRSYLERHYNFRDRTNTRSDYFTAIDGYYHWMFNKSVVNAKEYVEGNLVLGASYENINHQNDIREDEQDKIIVSVTHDTGMTFQILYEHRFLEFIRNYE